jgi:lipid-A-disaccharide synthase
VREILFVAGESSGDLHAARVARELVAAGAPYRLAGVGGDDMRDAGVELLEHVERLAVMGFAELLQHLPAHWTLFRRLRARLRAGNVALIVLIDYGGFNMRVAAAGHAAGVPVLYYITPQVWASRPGRARVLARTVSRAAVILPFEEALLRRSGVDATFVGHPLLDRLEALPDRTAARRALGFAPDDRVLALFPGSRGQEIKRHLDPFVAAATELQRRDPSLKVIVSAAPQVTIDARRCPFPTVRSASLMLFRAADAALCKSGTTTLEAAVAGCPLVVAYRTGRVDYEVARRLVTVPQIGLVNIVAGRPLAREFVQDDLQATAVADALAPLLDHGSADRRTMIEGLSAVRASLGRPGAAERVAAMAMALANGAPEPRVG